MSSLNILLQSSISMQHLIEHDYHHVLGNVPIKYIFVEINAVYEYEVANTLQNNPYPLANLDPCENLNYL